MPRLTVTPLGVFPRSKRLTVIGLFEIGAQPDAYQAYVSLVAGRNYWAHKQVGGLQVKTADLFGAPQTMAALAAELGDGYDVKDWSQTQGSLFRAVKMEKVMVSLLLLSVVAVAAFNIVSTLVMSVAEKRRDIAVLRTMGAQGAWHYGDLSSPTAWAWPAWVSSVGRARGVLLATNISTITAVVENPWGETVRSIGLLYQ